MYRAGLESVLGFRVHGALLSVDPCVPRNWPTYSVTFRYRSATYQIRVNNPSGVSRGVGSVSVDGKVVAGRANVPLVDDGAAHWVIVEMGR